MCVRPPLDHKAVARLAARLPLKPRVFHIECDTAPDGDGVPFPACLECGTGNVRALRPGLIVDRELILNVAFPDRSMIEVKNVVSKETKLVLGPGGLAGREVIVQKFADLLP